MDTAIEQMAQGAAIGLGLIEQLPFKFQYLYALIALISFILVYKDSGGSHSFLPEAKKHFLGIFLLWLFFGYGWTTTMDIRYQDRPYQRLENIPAGLRYSVLVIGEVMKWSAEMVDIISYKVYQNDFEPSKMPFAFEKYFIKIQKAQSELTKATASLTPDIEYWNRNCADFKKYGDDSRPYQPWAPNITHNYSYYEEYFIRDGAPQDCTGKSKMLVEAIKGANAEAAKAQNIDPDTFGRYDKRNMFERLVSAASDTAQHAATAIGNGGLAVFIRLFTLRAFYSAYLYAKVFPFFLKLLIIIYFVMYPFVLGLAMLPGRWKSIITYIEGYLWISFLPVVIAAVDGFSIAGLNNGGLNLFNLESTFIMLAKVAVVMSSPILTGFLLFGTRPRSTALSSIIGNAGSGMYYALSGPAYAKMRSMARTGGAGAGGAGSAQANRILSGGSGGGNVVLGSGGRGQPSARTPVTTAKSNYDMYKGNRDALNNARFAVTGDNSASEPDSIAYQMVSGNIRGDGNGGVPGGALGNISPEMLHAGVVAQVQDTGSGRWSSVHMQRGADGRVQFSKPENGTAADGLMATRLNNAAKGEMFAARTVVDGYKLRYLPGGGANVAKLRWGNEMNSENLIGGDLNEFLDKQEKRFV